MTDTSPSDLPADDAEAIYDEVHRRRAAGDDVEIEAICRDHPRIANALRALDSLEGVAEIAGVPAELEGAVVDLRAAEMTTGASSATPGTLDIGQHVGPYRIVDVLGEGGFAVVYRAEQTSPVRRFVALKAIKAGLDTRQVLARFEAERQALAMMSHTSIAKVFDAGTTELGRPYFVMEHVDGLPLSEFCDRWSLRIAERLELFLQVCDAIQHAHQKGIIHRDLKPANVLVLSESDRPVPKVIDFGIAKALGEDLTDSTLRTEVGQIIGTPAYMSPEQAAGEIEGVDTRTDIYALGVILYELLAGQRPFSFPTAQGLGLVEVQRIIREDTPPRPSQRVSPGHAEATAIARRRQTTVTTLARELRGDLDWITMQALAKDPSTRYASASELAEDVRRYQRTEPVLAGPPSLRYRLGKVARRHRRLLGTVTVVLVAALIAGWTASALVDRARDRDRELESVRLLDEGRKTAQTARALVAEAEARTRQLAQLLTTLPEWLPVWERAEELETRADLARRELEAGNTYGRAFGTMTLALDTAPLDSAVRRHTFQDLERLRDELNETRSSIPIGSLLSHNRTPAEASPDATTATISVTTSPPEAEVHLFRFEDREARKLPRPFLESGSSPSDGLIVERIWDESLASATDAEGKLVVFRPDDRWLDIAGARVSSFIALSDSLRDIQQEQVVALTILRGTEEKRLHWTPFRKSTEESRGSPLAGSRYLKGRLIDTRLQLGVTFDAYPLHFSDASRAGKTKESGALPVEVSSGSYLLVLRRAGHIDVRFPFVSGQDQEIHVDLPQLESALAGFVYVPAGRFRHGGNDPDNLQNLPYGVTRLDSFWIRRLEISLGEYLEFLRERADANGYCTPRSANVQSIVKAGKPILIQPFVGTPDRFAPLEPVDGEWRLSPRGTADSPLQGISYVAMLEYASWLSERTPGWRFNLPTDLQWEKAARGADWRRFVWGDFMIWSLCWSQPGIQLASRGFPSCRGAYPFDESVYGVRDMAGSVVEFAIGRPLERKTFRSCRGGGWGKFNEYRFRTDSRYGVPPRVTRTSCGIRLVATPD